MEAKRLENLTIQALISMASDARCRLEIIESEIFKRIQARANKHKPSRVRAVKKANQSKGNVYRD